MKKTYTKPLISVEVMSLDEPIAVNCDTSLKNDILDMMEFGYFMDDPRANCSENLLPTGGFDFDGDGNADSHDTVCYHSNIQKAFLS